MILRAVKNLFAPERHPMPMEEPNPPRDGDSVEEAKAKIEHMTQLAMRQHRAAVWRARLSGFDLATLIVTAVNMIGFLLMLSGKEITGLHYSQVIIFLTLFMSIGAKRLVKL